MVDLFLKYLSYERRFSPHTLRSYSIDLAQAVDFLEGNFQKTELAKATASELREFIAFLSEEGYDHRSVNRKIAALKSFFKFLEKKETLEHNPARVLSSLKTVKKLPEFVPESSTNQLFDGFFFEDSFEGQRDKLLLELLYGTGLRLTELIQLERRNVDLVQSRILVLGKNNKYRMIPLHEILKQELVKYLERCSQTFMNFPSELMLTDKGKKLYPVFVQRKVKTYLGLVSSLSKKSPHTLRHTFATHLLNHGADLNAIKELLGHSSLAATQIYTHNAIDKLKQIHKKAHPKS